MKKCTKCGIEKELSEYYKIKTAKDGHFAECKECVRIRVRKREIELQKDPNWVESERARHRIKYHRLEYREKHKPSSEAKKQIIKRYHEKYPEKRMAKSLMGKKVKPLVSGNELHHWSYNLQHSTSVIELSVKHHQKCHRFLVYDQERMMYRRIDNNELLDTKESHEQWIRWCIENKPD